MQLCETNLAVCPSQGLGDGVIQLVLAQNLALKGVSVSYYHHGLACLNSIFDKINVCDPQAPGFAQQLHACDIILADSGARAINLRPHLPTIKTKLATYSMARVAAYSFRRKRRLYNPQFSPLLKHKRPNEIDFRLFNGQTLSSNRFSGLNMAQHITNFLRTNKLNRNPSLALELSFPDSWKFKAAPMRILIHPTSSTEKKNWLPQKYIRLAEELESKGFEPVFTMSAAEADKWRPLLKNRFDLPVFTDLRQLAAYYHASALLIGNDSGNGHLASLLGLPTITIIGRRYRSFSWRPSWGNNIVVKPLLSRKIIGNRYWQHTLGITKVINAVHQLCDQP